jgi:hypothetical protein
MGEGMLDIWFDLEFDWSLIQKYLKLHLPKLLNLFYGRLNMLQIKLCR